MDDGWIFRRARFYRGAIQEEDERAGGRALLLAMVASPEWIGHRFAALRTAARLLPHVYVTERRIRYAASPALASSAVFFKSGSLYQCKPEPGFDCRPYAANGKNYMNSVAIVEHPAGARRLYYMVTIVSNVLRRNSASVHMELATRLQKLVESLHAAPRP